MTESRNSLNSVMISDDSISDCSERGFSDIENSRPSTELKSILRVSSFANEERNKLIFKKVNLCLLIIAIIIYVPFTLFDFIYAYTDTSCVDIYPNKLNINMKIYLLVSGYIELVDLIIMLCSALVLIMYEESKYDTIIYVKFFVNIIVKLFLEIWTIIGAIIFWGTLYNIDDCSRTTYNYLFATLIIKLVLLTYYLNVKRSNYKKI